MEREASQGISVQSVVTAEVSYGCQCILKVKLLNDISIGQAERGGITGGRRSIGREDERKGKYSKQKMDRGEQQGLHSEILKGRL